MPINMRDKRELAARALGVGIKRIKFDPEYVEDVIDAITREDMRSLLTARTILIKKKHGTSRGRTRARHLKEKKHGRGQGSKEGAKGARRGKKDAYVKKVRTLRRHLKIMKNRGEVSKQAFWNLYRKVGGGQVRSVAHLRELAKEVSSR
jgi:large subunit ribosomal protein L19e